MSLLPENFHTCNRDHHMMHMTEQQQEEISQRILERYSLLFGEGFVRDVVSKGEDMFEGKSYCMHGSGVHSYSEDLEVPLVDIAERLAGASGEVRVCDLFSDPSFIRDLESRTQVSVSGWSVGREDPQMPDASGIGHMQCDLGTLHGWREVVSQGPFDLIVSRAGYGLRQIPFSFSHNMRYLESVWDSLADGGEAYLHMSFVSLQPLGVITPELLRARFAHMDTDSALVDVQESALMKILAPSASMDEVTTGSQWHIIHLKKDNKGSLIRRIHGLPKGVSETSLEIGDLQVFIENDQFCIQRNGVQSAIDLHELVDYSEGWLDNISFASDVPVSFRFKNETLLYVLLSRKMQKNWTEDITIDEIWASIDAIARVGIGRLHQLILSNLPEGDREGFGIRVV